MPCCQSLVHHTNRCTCIVSVRLNTGDQLDRWSNLLILQWQKGTPYQGKKRSVFPWCIWYVAMELEFIVSLQKLMCKLNFTLNWRRNFFQVLCKRIYFSLLFTLTTIILTLSPHTPILNLSVLATEQTARFKMFKIPVSLLK